MMRSKAGFTLIELLISVALMIILVSAVTMIFVNTTEVVAVQEARMTVYTNARYALDIMENDLMGAFGLNQPMPPAKVAAGASNPGGASYVPGEHIPQAFWMDNGVLKDGGGQFPQLNVSGQPKDHVENAGDAIGFRTVTTVADSIQTCEVTYLLIPGDHAMETPDPTTASPINRPYEDVERWCKNGDSSHKQTARTNRGLYTLVRRVRMQADPPKNAPATMTPLPFDRVPLVSDKLGQKVTAQDQELCHYIVSFNLEYMANNRAFSQLAPSPFPHADPIGEENGLTNDAPGKAFRVPAIRVTLRIVDDTGERQERTIQKVLWIPQQ